MIAAYRRFARRSAADRGLGQYLARGRAHRRVAAGARDLRPWQPRGAGAAGRIARDKAAGNRKLRRLTTPYQGYRDQVSAHLSGNRPAVWSRPAGATEQRPHRAIDAGHGRFGYLHFSQSRGEGRPGGLSGESTEARGLGSQKPQEAFDYLAGEVTIGDLQFADFPVDAFRTAKTSDYDGLIGADVFERFLVSIDFKDMRLTLDAYPKSRAPPMSRRCRRLSAARLLPRFSLRTSRHRPDLINQGPLQLFLIDSGSSANLIDTDVARESTKVRGDYHTVLRGIQGRADKVSRASQVSLVFAGFRQDNSDLLATSLEVRRVGRWASGIVRNAVTPASSDAGPAADEADHRLSERSRTLRAQEMTRYFICLCMLAIPARAQELTAQQVLDRVVSTYSNLKAVHIVAEREETTYPAGRSRTSFSECELAAKPGHRYFARLKLSHEQALSVSDGSNIWRALDSKKQWSQVSAASLADDNDEEQGAKAANTGPARYPGGHAALPVSCRWPSTRRIRPSRKQQDFKLGHEKVRCYLIRARTRSGEIELSGGPAKIRRFAVQGERQVAGWKMSKSR
jgi:hypothetical protein